MSRSGVHGWMFLLVPAHPGRSGQRALKWLCVFVCVLVFKTPFTYVIDEAAVAISEANCYIIQFYIVCFYYCLHLIFLHCWVPLLYLSCLFSGVRKGIWPHRIMHQLSVMFIIWLLEMPSVLWHCWLSIRPLKTEWWGAGMVVCLERCANENDLHMVQLMPLPPDHLCFSKIQNGLSLWYPFTQVVLERGH